MSKVNTNRLAFLGTRTVGDKIKTTPNQPADKFTNRSEIVVNHIESTPLIEDNLSFIRPRVNV